jgi:ribosomal protein RSM22 (predicted rRNA methylase)
MTDNVIQLIDDLAAAVGGDVNALNTAITAIEDRRGDLSQLTTAQKSSIVAALNELKATVDGIDVSAAIDDATTDNAGTWSSNKISTEIQAAIVDLKDNAPAAFDTLKEISVELASNSSLRDSILAAQAKRVRFDAAQSLSAPEKNQARANIGAAATEEVAGVSAKLGNVASANPVGTYNSAKG